MMCYFLTSSGIVALFHAVIIENSKDDKKIRRHNRILTNEELRSNEPNVDKIKIITMSGKE